ncbi:hypothetical protein [Paucidesulfovibrio gracilis]|uniref:hypothetical protein n=1 Tax=Paucidesulfovibrio gracilis TaxID=47158 RepID=UPI001F27975E|nr:hypothetical protein [Paucidesulfovibrio gracilis]
MSLRYLFAVLLAVMLVSACSTLQDSWEGTKEMAQGVGEFVNPDPEVDFNAYEFENPNQEKLARLMTPVDGPLKSLIRYVSDRDSYPDEKWIDLLFLRYPWIHSLIVVNEEGWMLDRLPDAPLKRITEPLVYEANWRETFLQTVVDYPELGPELYIGTPFFKDADFAGLILVSVDPRTLLDFCPKPEELVMLQPGGAAWSMNRDRELAPLEALPWDEILEDDVLGTVDADGQCYTWLVRYVGSDPYVYATPCSDAEARDSGWLPF